MAIFTALHHRTEYRYDRKVMMGPQVIRLRPAPHCRTPISSYSLTIDPEPQFLHWQQDPYGNYLARAVFAERVDHFRVEVDLISEMTVINPFDFFTEPEAEYYPFAYPETVRGDLTPFFQVDPAGPLAEGFLAEIPRDRQKTIDFLVELNRRVQQEIQYEIRMEPGVQSPEETLQRRCGSCRDSAWLLVHLLRHLGLAARFASGYIIQLTADVKALDGPSGTDRDFTDLHAWTEVFLPGAGWIGLDPTSGLLAGEGHIPLACTPAPISAAPVTGGHEKCEVEFGFEMEIRRFHEDPRVTKPYTDTQWERIDALGDEVDRRLADSGVRLTMGGEPTFVSIDDMEGEEWTTDAVGPTKRGLADRLMKRLHDRFAPGGMLHYGEGKWYPGEPLPRWAFRCYWRTDGQPIWQDPALFADDEQEYGHTIETARQFSEVLTGKLGLDPAHISYGYEDAFYYTWRERRLPANVELHDSKLEDRQERERIARIFEQGITAPVGCVLPLRYRWWESQPRWESGPWLVRSEELFLVPGDSAMGLRLPLESLAWAEKSDRGDTLYPLDPLAEAAPLPPRRQLLARHLQTADYAAVSPQRDGHFGDGQSIDGQGNDFRQHSLDRGPLSSYGPTGEAEDWQRYSNSTADPHPDQPIRTALCVESRQGRLHVFFPPLDRIEAWLELVTAVEETAAELQTPVVLEGYLPPHDDRINHFSVTPDPGVIEVNVQPAHNWRELVAITEGVYEDAHHTRLGTEKFNLDGSHTGTGGGNHMVLGGPTPLESPFLRRPDLLRSLVAYWHNHPSLSYLFSGSFIGPTSQAPRVDEGRRDSVYELQIAFEQIPEQGECPPWLVDRIFRHILVDLTGNTHRAEFCIDKMYSPDTASGRRGLLEFRAFEMPPHPRMSLTQQLLLRSLVSRFWDRPYRTPLVDWDTSIHDRFMMPHFVWEDFLEVIRETAEAGIPLEGAWFAPHFEFRFPKIGDFTRRGVHVELRRAIEPWYVLGEEPAGGAMARYVDSSVERMQVKVQGASPGRHYMLCNGRLIPLHPTGIQGEAVAAVRYRAWQPPSCLHPTIEVDEPLVFDLYDDWNQRSMGGCRYFVGHPGGNNPESFPVNAFEAEARRGARFHEIGHTGGTWERPTEASNPDFPMTLDLRRGRGAPPRP